MSCDWLARRKLVAGVLASAIIVWAGSPAAEARGVGSRLAPAGAPHDNVWKFAEQYRVDQIDLLKRLVNIDSGTGDEAGGQQVAGLIASELRAIGADVTMVPSEIDGLPANLVASFTGTGRGKLLLIGHFDTVFEPGSAAKRPFRMNATRAYGPGVVDEKGGVVEAIFALKILRRIRFHDFRKITLLVESSEERGSPGSRNLIRQLIADADVELNLEPGDPPDRITVWRKGSTTIRIDVTGRAAHAGIAPEQGRNAAVELIHQIEASRWPTSGAGLTANLTVMSAGTRGNIIPDRASALVNVRYRDKADFAPVVRQFQKNALAPSVPDTKVTISTDGAYPPLSETPAVDALADKARRIYAKLGMSLERSGNGGASESALAQDAGLPALDGLGPVGGGTHSENEFLELRTLTPRLYLLTRLIIELGQEPPVRR